RIVKALAHRHSRISGHNRVRCHALGHNRPRGHDSAFTNDYTGHDHGPHADPGTVMDVGVAFAHIGVRNLVHEGIQAEPVHAMGMVAAHQNHCLGTDARVVPTMQLVYWPLRGPGLAAVFVPVQVTHHAFFKTAGPGMAVVAVCATHMDVGVGYGFVQEFDLRPVLLHHASPSGPCRAGFGFAPVL